MSHAAVADTALPPEPTSPEARRGLGVCVLTFGCRLNSFESEVIRARAAAAGLTDTVVVNTCAVTAEAERQARQAIRRARREAPGARIVVTGCAAQIDPAAFAAMPEVDHVLGNREKLAAASYRALAAGEAPRVRAGDIMAVRETAGHLLAGFNERVRAFVEIQQGCDHRCTFCVIPYARGPNRSVPVAAVVEQVGRLVEAGLREVVLTGVDITGYGRDLPGRPTLGRLAEALLAQVPALPRLRLSSLDPAEVDETLIALIGAEPRLMPHLHLSLQAGDDLVLKRMKRRHARADAVAFCDRVRALRPGIALGADLIAGFPTETEAMAANTLSLVADCGLCFLHVFPFSPRRGTPAARMPQVPPAEIRARAARLRAAGAAARSRFLEAQVGRVAAVLVERRDAVARGHSEHFAPVRFTGPAAVGEIVPVRITGCDGEALLGRQLDRVPAA
ncbi:MAG: tRNA (N(6)-L-threonylcarbamoyladenosine(37)-C(2))-methylthiotransferase MtaB [Rhodospirillaceae bacterium]|nr:tRNA (N(6)-L-threonylcarbamoyladenosine(37)-C(2))-methylthiotransferase MtaB [Rhodospirillaceae bacterium]